MPNSHAYQVETLAQAVLLIGDSWLVGELGKKFRAQNIQVFTSSKLVPDDLDLDYVFLEGEDLDLNSDKLQSLLTTHAPRAIYLSHTNQTQPERLPTGINQVSYSDCFGPDFTQAPTLTNLLDSAKTNHTISLPDDGLTDYHLLTNLDLLEGIYILLTSTQPISVGATRESPILTNPASISLLSLAYLIRSNLGQEVKLDFDSVGATRESPGVTSPPIPGWKPTKDLTEPLIKFIQSYIPVGAGSSRPSPHVTPPLPTPLSPQPPKADPPRADKLSKLSDLVKSTVGARSSRPQKTKSQPPPQTLEFAPISPDKKKLKLPKLTMPKFSRPPQSPQSPKTDPPWADIPKPLTIITGGLIVAFFLYLLTIITSLTLTALTLRSLKSSYSTSSLPTQKSLVIARIPAVFLEANLVAISSLPLISNSTTITELTSLSTYYRHGLDSILLAHDLASTSSSLLSYVIGAGEGDILDLINRSRLLSSELYESLSLLSGSLPPEPPNIIPSSLHDSYQELILSLQTLRSSTLIAKALLATAPDLLGVGDRRKYLVLFQNNMELRPTGGFIGSFALMSFENGKLYDMPIYDVYAADGQLKGHVEPPTEIKEYLGEANWYLRDSNWDPDFPTSARRAEWFLDKTLDKQVDGTIAINVYTLADLLEAIDPITIPDYDEQITASNIFERAEYHSEVNFFPGSTQKKEFLSSVADTLFTQLEELTPEQALPVAQALAKGIDEKNTLLAVSSDATNHVFSTLGWNGEMQTPTCPALGGPCYSDYAMLVDANLGVNKANYFLRRSLTLTTTLSKDLTPSHTLKVQYQNTSTSSSWPAGPYKTYSRLYLPSDVIFDSLIIDGQPVDHEDITLSAQHDRLVIGYLFTVPIDSTLDIEIRYHRARSLSKDSPTYSFYWQKQPGTAGDPFNIYLNYPLYLEPTIVSPTAQVSDQQLEFTLSNITDRRVTVKFQ